jgi:proline dehydrogenase
LVKKWCVEENEWSLQRVHEFMNPLIKLIPASLVKAFARPYVAGDDLLGAIDVAARLWLDEGLYASLDLLAEDVDSVATAREHEEIYYKIIDAIAEDERFTSQNMRPTVSLKLSSYTTEPLDRGGKGLGSTEAVSKIAAYAREKSVGLTIDMENRQWTEHTLQFLDELHLQGHQHVGAVIQTRLHRSRKDLEGLPKGCRVRLVIGIYNEPEEAAIVDKQAMKERLLEYAAVLLERGHYVEFASHDELYIQRFLDEVVRARGFEKENFEIQMLYGVPRKALQHSLIQMGVKTRLYVPFAVAWGTAIAYLRRRLDEYPKMMWLVVKNLFSGS